MSIIVQKYGGTSVASIDKIKNIAKNILRVKENGHDVVVVVSAMGNTTNTLLEMANEITQNPDRRELDMLLTTGERQTISLLSIALKNLGQEAISLTGSQSGIITNTSHNKAKILEIRPYRIEDALNEGKIVIVAGFQGVSYLKEITTLGRGGSDTTALALTAALNAIYCEIYSDVDGVFSANPRVVKLPQKLDSISYDQMLAMSENGAKVLAADAVRFAKHYKIKLYSKNAFKSGEGTFITDESVMKTVLAITSEENLIVVNLKKSNLERALLWLMDVNILYKELFSNNDKVTFIFDRTDIHDEDYFINWLEKCNVEFHLNMAKVNIIGNKLYEDPMLLLNAMGIIEGNKIKLYFYNLKDMTSSFIIDKNESNKLVELFHSEFIE
jgi:aspartate kinase